MFSCFRPLLGVSLMGVVMLGLGFTAVPALAEEEEQVVAIVNGEKLYRADLDVAIRMLPSQYQKMPIDIVYPALVDQVVEAKLVEEEGRKNGFLDKADVQASLKRAEGRIIQQAYLTSYVEDNLNEESMRVHYKELMETAEPREEVHARHILVSDEAQARDIIAELANGGDFVEIAREKSVGPEAANGGDLGFFSADQMVPEFAEAAFALEPGATSEAPVRSSYGWHVIKVEDRRVVGPPTFEEAQNEVATSLSKIIIGKMIADLRDGAKIEVFNLDGTPMKDKK